MKCQKQASYSLPFGGRQNTHVFLQCRDDFCRLLRNHIPEAKAQQVPPDGSALLSSGHHTRRQLKPVVGRGELHAGHQSGADADGHGAHHHLTGCPGRTDHIRGVQVVYLKQVLLLFASVK